MQEAITNKKIRTVAQDQPAVAGLHDILDFDCRPKFSGERTVRRGSTIRTGRLNCVNSKKYLEGGALQGGGIALGVRFRPIADAPSSALGWTYQSRFYPVQPLLKFAVTMALCIALALLLALAGCWLVGLTYVAIVKGASIAGPNGGVIFPWTFGADAMAFSALGLVLGWLLGMLAWKPIWSVSERGR